MSNEQNLQRKKIVPIVIEAFDNKKWQNLVLSTNSSEYLLFKLNLFSFKIS